MKKIILVTLMLFGMLFDLPHNNQAEAKTNISFNVFFDALAPYGNWVSVPDYGYAWYPHGIGRNWQPYSDGRWLWSDQGWLWSSYEPWGWATYHYGRWVFNSYYGWIWVPGTVWAPAWVTWYTSPDYIGWAPLPPDDYFFSGGGIGFDYDDYYDDDYYDYGYRHRRHHDYYVHPSHCVFVPSRHFFNHRIHSVAVSRSRNVTIIKNTKKVTNIKLVNNSVVNYGPDVRSLEKRAGNKIRKVNVVESDLTVHRKGAKNVNKLKGDNYFVFRPEVVNKGNETTYLKGIKKKSSVEIEKRKRLVLPKFQKSSRVDEPFVSKGSYEDRYNGKPHIEKFNNKKGNPPKAQNVYIAAPEKDNYHKSFDRDYQESFNGSRKNSFVTENTVRSQIRDTYAEDNYSPHKSFRKKSSFESEDLIKSKRLNKGSYSSPHIKRDLGYDYEENRGNRNTYQQNSRQNSRKNVKLDFDMRKKTRGAFDYQNKLRKEPKGMRNQNRGF